jgi:hypothetical protein
MWFAMAADTRWKKIEIEMGETSYLTNVWLPPPKTGAIFRRCGKGIGPAQWLSGILSLALIGNIILDCWKLKVWGLTMLLFVGSGAVRMHQHTRGQ